MTSIPPSGPGQDRDEAFERLRAADPAAGSEPDLTALRAAVAARAEAGSAAGDQLAVRRRRWPVAAAAAAALVLGTGGGYAVGAAQGGAADSGMSVAADEAVAEDAAGGAEMDSGLAPERLPADGGGVASDSASDMAWWGYGRTVFTAQGLSDSAGTAPVWAVDAISAFDAETMALAAQALGVDGTPEQVDGIWTVGSQDGSAPGLSMYPDGSAALSYYDPTTDPWSCPAEDDAEPERGCTERDLGPAPDAVQAEQEMADLLVALGLDPAAFEMEADAEDQWTYLTAYELVDGERSGRTWNATWTGAGLQSLYGSVAPLVSLGEYAVISPAAAVERLSDPRFGTSGPMYFDDTVSVMPVPDTVEQSTVPDTPEPGSAVSWPVHEVTITGAELTMQIQTDGSGAVLLVPTYELSGDDGSVWSVIAVADDALDFSS